MRPRLARFLLLTYEDVVANAVIIGCPWILMIVTSLLHTSAWFHEYTLRLHELMALLGTLIVSGKAIIRLAWSKG